MKPESFVAACLRGAAGPEDVDVWVSRWHTSGSPGTLAAWLGLTAAEYALWSKQPETLPYIIDTYKMNQDRWEYRTETVGWHDSLGQSGVDDALLNKLGQDRWELVSCVVPYAGAATTGYVTGVFKRRLYAAHGK